MGDRPNTTRFRSQFRISRARVTFRYLPDGSVKHALILDERSYTGHLGHAVCGIDPLTNSFGPWMGTGSQDEYEEVDRRRLCKNCESQLAPEKKEGEGVSSGEPK